jgi:hypothetical protein
MRRYKGNETVNPGIYFNLRELAFRSMEDEGRLPGGEKDVWRAVPFVVMLVVSPVLGILYAIFLPLIGFVMLAGVVLGWAYRHVEAALLAGTRVLRPAWQPALAFLARGRAKVAVTTKEETKPEEKDPWKEAVRRKLEETVEGEERES